ncbi:peptidase domain-containing ABC transporter [Spirulina sp. CCNP1310]|uniref:peptidase domain-containing ABC transporter n=1 Tax=Spirulina sp. CCNP1310 TaxID=3110249 RepID=UPI002B21723C|nr:peptidase domain-containing ABC transporter [Spirulina sp. CCNP1310]MEA5419892.1 peptidase domain-containing ABC transporter [Spirulina sp. CCNP1310]
MAYTVSEIQSFLTAQTPLGMLPPGAIAAVLGRMRPFRYRMGQTLLVRDKIPHQVVILYEGQVRLIGYDPTTKMPLTLQLLQPGDMIGWVSLLRGIPCETAIASTETVAITLGAEEFFAVLQRFPDVAAQFHQGTAIAEVFDLLSRQTLPNLKDSNALKEWVQNAANHAQVCSLPPGRHLLQDEPARILQYPNLVWFVSGGGQVTHFKPGYPISLDPQQRSLEVVGEYPARLIGIQAADLLPVAIADTFADPDTVQLSPEPAEIPYAAELETVDAPTPPSAAPKPNRQDYPLVKGRSQLDAAVACFQMLSQYFRMPFRRDVIERVLGDQLRRQGSLSLYNCGSVAELMGLTAQLVNIPASALTRLQGPALVQWQDRLAVLYEISDQELVIGAPEVGILRRKPKDFLEAWDDVGQVVLLQPSKYTPQERFGLSWFWPVLWKYKGVLTEVFIASFFVQLFALANPLIIQVIIDKVIVQNSTETLQVLGFFLLGVAIFEFILSTVRTYLFVDTTNRIDMSLGSEIIDHLLRLPLSYFDRRPVGELSSRINELENIRTFLTGTALTVVLDAVFSVIYIAVMFFYSWRLSLLGLAIVPIFIITTLIFSPLIRHQLRIKAERNAETQSHLVEVVSGIQTVKAQNIELRSRWRWQEHYARYVSAGFKTVQTSTLANSASNFLNKISGLLVLWGGAYLVLQGDLSLGQLIAFRIIASYVTSPLLRLAQLWQNFQEVGLSLERLGDILDSPQEGEADQGNIPMPSVVGAVKYENVSFRFKPNGPLQLVNVNLDIPAGSFVGVVGKSGAGKSTLTKLLVRLYDWETGRILLDGYDVAKVELYSLRRQIGVVPQEPLLFDGTIQENIALNNPEASSEEIIEAARVAAAHDFIMELSSGYNTRVGERGASLSGGQRQRIAIARTVLQRPAFLILDEATSALDYPTEQQVCSNLAQAFRDRTVIFITHRLGTVQGADQIVMMDSGAVVEVGTHAELIALEGRYFALYRQQDARQA